MVRLKGIAKLLSGILEEMHIQSSVERQKKRIKQFDCNSACDDDTGLINIPVAHFCLREKSIQLFVMKFPGVGLEQY